MAFVMDIPKLIGLMTITVMVLSFFLMVFGLIPSLHFWIIAILSALIAYFVMPRLRKHYDK